MRPDLDHRVINQDLEVFATDPAVGAGLPLWLPAGAVIRQELEQLARDLARRDGCQSVHTPVLAKRELFEQSGHWDKFSDDMFPPMSLGGSDLVLRPANCPHHATVYSTARHSYRELPIRLHELAPMFRAERSGVLSGLSRVRQITLDDTHVFCRPDQVAAEAARALRSALEAQRVLGLPIDYVRLSLRDDSDAFLGAPAQWEQAEAALREAAASVGVAEAGMPLRTAAGEAAFYGPKVDLQVRDGRGHEETIATVQVDFVQPEQFNLSYDAADGTRRRVVMIHRGTVGSMERVVGSLLERYQGRLPLWLAPVQVCVLPVAPDQDGAARSLVDDLLAVGLRARLDVEGTLGARIRVSRQRRDCRMAVIGPAEDAASAVQVTDPVARFQGLLDRRTLPAFLRQAHLDRRQVLQWQAAEGPEPEA